MDQYKQKIIRHLGIVAGICNEMELIQTIDGEAVAEAMRAGRMTATMLPAGTGGRAPPGEASA